MFDLASATVGGLSGQFAESDNPLIQMLGGGKNVKVSVGSSGPTSQVIDELKASQTQTETLIKTSETKYTELIDAVGQKLDEVATKQKEVLDKEVTQVTQVNLDTDVLATAMKNWRGAGGTVQFEVKAS
jgi:ATP phosphoribosyltransferase regulatory subunit HisZ